MHTVNITRKDLEHILRLNLWSVQVIENGCLKFTKNCHRNISSKKYLILSWMNKVIKKREGSFWTGFVCFLGV